MHGSLPHHPIRTLVRVPRSMIGMNTASQASYASRLPRVFKKIPALARVPLGIGVAQRSEAGEQAVEWGRYAVGVEGLDEDAAVADLAPFLRAEEAPQLLL
jgi:hypothetical protein